MLLQGLLEQLCMQEWQHTCDLIAALVLQGLLDQLRICVEACGLGELFKETGKDLITPRAPTRKFKQVHDERLMRQLLVSSAPVHTGECLPSTTAFICW